MPASPLTERETAILHAASSTCPAPGCSAQVPLDRFMCPRHWRMVPGELQVEIYRAWVARGRDPRDTAAIARHETAKKVALEALVALETMSTLLSAGGAS